MERKCTLVVACCPLVSHVEYAPTGQRRTDGRTDGRQTVTLRYAAIVKIDGH